MSAAYAEEIRPQCPGVEIVYNLFHVVAKYGREVIDRVLRHCHSVNIRGNSYRMRVHTELYRDLRPKIETEEPVRRIRRAKAAAG